MDFIVFAAINCTDCVPVQMYNFANELSRWCPVITLSAHGMKTQLKELASVGIKPILLLVSETVFMVSLALQIPQSRPRQVRLIQQEYLLVSSYRRVFWCVRRAQVRRWLPNLLAAQAS